MPRIVTISGGRRSFVPTEAGAGGIDPTESLPACLDGLRHCSLVGQSPTLRPDFIILTQPHCILYEQYRTPLASTVSLLLEKGYSITLQTLSVGDSDLRVFLLAAPCGTNPQWIDEALSDHQIMSRVANKTDEVARTSTTGTEIRHSDGGNSQDMSLDQSTQGSHVVARQVAIVVSRIIGELSKENQHQACSTTWAGRDGYQRRAKKQKPRYVSPAYVRSFIVRVTK